MRMKPKLIHCLFLSLAFFAALSGPAAGAANVSRSPTRESLAPRIAVDSVGNLHVVWAEYSSSSENGNAYYSMYDIVAQTWSTPLNLSNNGRVYTEEKRPVGIAIDGSDNIHVIYVEKTRISMRTKSGGTWGAPFILANWSTGSADTARIAVDFTGNIFTCWWTMDSFKVHSRARIDGVWEDVIPVSLTQSKFPDIAVGENVAFLCWTGKDPVSGMYQIYYTKRSKSFGATWENPRVMYRGSVKQQVPAIEVDYNDIGHIVFTPVLALGGLRVVRYCRWTGGGWTSPQSISTQGLLHYPALDEREGNLYCCWQIGAYGNGIAIYGNSRIGPTWTGEQLVPESSGSTYCDVAVSPGLDKVYYVWDAGGEIWCNMGASTGVGDNVPPTAEFGFHPGTGIYPVDITFDGSDSRDEDGSIVQYSWNFGDGGRASGRVVSHTYNSWGTFSVRLIVLDDQGASGSRTRTIEILRLFQPLDIRWQTHRDESLFQTRHVCQVTWNRNPANDNLGVQVVLHRVWRKKADEPDIAFQLIGEVSGDSYSFLDTAASVQDAYSYTVTVRDSQGHESPIVGGGGNPVLFEPVRSAPSLSRRGKQPIR